MGLSPVGAGLGHVLHHFLDVGLVQPLSVHIDAVGGIVDIHRLSAGGDDPLDDGHAPQVLHRGLVQHHNVPLLRLIAQGLDQQQLSVVQGILHGRPVHPGEPPKEGEHDHQAHQGGGQGVEPVKYVLRGLLLLLLRGVFPLRRGPVLRSLLGLGGGLLLGLLGKFKCFRHGSTSCEGCDFFIIPAPGGKCNLWRPLPCGVGADGV